MELAVTILTLWAVFQTFWCQVVTVNLLSFSSRADKSWFGWAWGAESTVSIVDRSPPLSFQSRPAAFGVEISSPILGYVIPLASFTTECPATNVSDFHLYRSPNTGCPKLCVNGPHQPDPSESWIALVQRGKCEFVSKVREAQRLGARAVVVGGQDPGVSGLPDTLVNMYSPEDSSDVKIAATFIKYSDYTELSSLIASSNTSHSGLATLSLLITADYSAWEWYSPVITFVIILFLPSLLTFITLVVHRIHAARAAQRDRAPEDVVRSLPWLVWNGKGSAWEKHEGPAPSADLEQALPRESAPEIVQESTSQSIPDAQVESSPTQESSDNDELDASTSALPKQHSIHWFESQMECAICLCEFVKGDKVRILPCHHIFHMEEVDEWLIQRKKLCPICKSDVTQPEEAEDDSEQTTEPTAADAGPDPVQPSPPRPFPVPWAFFSHPGSQPTSSPFAAAPENEGNERTPLLGANSQQSSNYSGL